MDSREVQHALPGPAVVPTPILVPATVPPPTMLTTLTVIVANTDLVEFRPPRGYDATTVFLVDTDGISFDSLDKSISRTGDRDLAGSRYTATSQLHAPLDIVITEKGSYGGLQVPHVIYAVLPAPPTLSGSNFCCATTPSTVLPTSMALRFLLSRWYVEQVVWRKPPGRCVL